MIVMNENFPSNCLSCPVRKRIGCAVAENSGVFEGIIEGIPLDCPFEPAEPVIPGAESSGVFHTPPNSYTVAECICLMCLKRFIDVRPEGLLLKDMECPGCHQVGYIIETGEYLTENSENYG